MKARPPRIARWLAAVLLPPSEREFVIGDLDELFERDAAALGRARARVRYWRQAFGLVRHRIPPPYTAASPRRSLDMSSLWRDVVIGARTAWHAKTYSAIAILTLGLAIGANTLLFSIANPIVVRALPIKDPDSLGWIQTVNAPRAIDRGQISMPDLLEFRERAKSFSAIAAYEVQPATLTGHRQDPERVTTLRGTANVTDVWGMKSLTGRLFQADDGEAGRPLVAVLSSRYWRERFQRDLGVIGRQFLLNGQPLTVVGVMPPEVELGNMSLVDMWVPEPMNPNAPRDARTLRAFGRLAPGATLDGAAAEVLAISQQQAKDHPESHQDWDARVVSTRRAMTSGNTWLVLLLLAIVVGFVLLIACANLANLVMARLVARKVDLAVRQALGASRWQLVRPLLAESTVLSLIGGVVGVALAYAGLRTVNAVAYEPFMKTLAIDGNVLIFAALISIVTPLIFCLWPAMSAGKATSAETLRDSRTSGGRAGRRRRDVLVAAQVALALSLLVVSTLAVRSMLYLRHIDTGLDISALASFRFELPDDRYPDDAARARFATELADRLGALSGVTSVAVVSSLPVFDREVMRQIEGLSLGSRANDQPWASWFSVTPAYFRATGVAVLTGRGFADGDTDRSQSVAIINRTAADRYFGGVPAAIGRQIVLAGRNEPKRSVTIVGVAADTRAPNITTTSPQVYVPFAQWPARAMLALTRSTAPDRQTADLRAAMRGLDATVPISDLRTVSDIEADENSSSGIINGLFISFALLALLLAAGGLYGVISYSVGQRTREIGVRLALGAAPSGIRRLVLVDGLKVTAIGMAIGLVLAVGFARLAAPVLFGISPSDPVTFGAVTATVLLVSIASIAAPAFRAMRTDPARTLRAD